MYGTMDDYAPAATMAEAHAEWHRNGGVGCPWDACDPYAEAEAEAAEEAYRAELVALAPTLREGEEPAPGWRDGYKPDEYDSPHWLASDPPF